VAGAAPCYRSGTRILTDRGEVAVEVLRVGDLVHTVLTGTLMPIIWVGRREVDCARHQQPRKVWPVRVAAGAFGDGRPHSDLFLSPDHAVYVEDVLIPIQHLINGSTIRQVVAAWITYYHLELAEHDVVLAEGLPAETFLDMRDGSTYANRPGPLRLYPDFSARMWEAFACAPLIVTGPELDAVRAMVASCAARRPHARQRNIVGRKSAAPSAILERPQATADTTPAADCTALVSPRTVKPANHRSPKIIPVTAPTGCRVGA
jgi:hypothetical protein